MNCLSMYIVTIKRDSKYILTLPCTARNENLVANKCFEMLIKYKESIKPDDLILIESETGHTIWPFSCFDEFTDVNST